MVVCENPSRSAVSEILRAARLHQQPFHVQSPLNPFLPRSDARFELQQVVFTTSRWLNALSCCHVIGWLAICVTKQSNRLLGNRLLIKWPVSVYNKIWFISVKQSWIFQHKNSSLTWSFRNNYNMLICCSRNVSDYYWKYSWKQLCRFIFLWKLWYIFFQDSMMNRKFSIYLK